MSTITKQSIGFEAVINEVELTGTDTLGATTGTLYVRNDTAGTVTIGILGDGVAAETFCSGVGDVDTSTPYQFDVGVGEIVTLPLNSVQSYLEGSTVNVTGGAASVFAYII